MPDFAYKAIPMNDEFPDSVASLWVIEIISPTDKIVHSGETTQLSPGGNFGMGSLPTVERSEVYAPGQSVKTFGINHVLDGETVLPNFKLAVKELFAE
jgi:hypothetical protein